MSPGSREKGSLTPGGLGLLDRWGELRKGWLDHHKQSLEAVGCWGSLGGLQWTSHNERKMAGTLGISAT